MIYRKSVFIVVYSIDDSGNIKYLLLKRKLHWIGWEFPKGGINFFETKRRAIKREIKEETGLTPIKIKKFNFSGKFKYDRKLKDRPGIIGQSFSLYAVKIGKGKVKIDKVEHSDYKWVKFNGAMKKLKWPNQKKCLKMVDGWLRK
ncbi:NUDIX domain-containing protein [Candidatus Pacearchaeota archaeon]|nr:NUDIX domain-containing protein [Candidatus Pacearchaeota archaeon]